MCVLKFRKDVPWLGAELPGVSGPRSKRASVVCLQAFLVPLTFVSNRFKKSRIEFFWDVTPCRWAAGFRRFGKSYCLHLHDTLPVSSILRRCGNTAQLRRPGCWKLKEIVERWKGVIDRCEHQ
jgi:hypothetical protein